ncbi:hypothetical protein JTB14_005502 [Gonioctena quinquepunctata]|nr:hypothetical protein JTB14_005502 [Gonioctena quinquepunctata]
MMKKEMLNVKALEQQQNDILNLNQHSLETCNLAEVRSDAVYRKVRSEAFAENDRDEDDIFDFIKIQRDHPNYIQFVGTPPHIYLHSAEQLALFPSRKSTTLHLDATGTIVRRPGNTGNKIYYYAGVIQIFESNRVCPVLGMVSSEHDAGSIGAWLLKYRCFCMIRNKKWRASFSKSCFSFAILNAVSISFNSLD